MNAVVQLAGRQVAHEARVGCPFDRGDRSTPSLVSGPGGGPGRNLNECTVTGTERPGKRDALRPQVGTAAKGEPAAGHVEHPRAR